MVLPGQWGPELQHTIRTMVNPALVTDIMSYPPNVLLLYIMFPDMFILEIER